MGSGSVLRRHCATVTDGASPSSTPRRILLLPNAWTKDRAVFDQNYVREHISLGYDVTVHSAQGVTADASLAVLRENTSRNLLYVAMTRGRHANVAHIYERAPKQANSAASNLPKLTPPSGVTAAKPPGSSAAFSPTTNPRSPRTTTPPAPSMLTYPIVSASCSICVPQPSNAAKRATKLGRLTGMNSVAAGKRPKCGSSTDGYSVARTMDSNLMGRQRP